MLLLLRNFRLRSERSGLLDNVFLDVVVDVDVDVGEVVGDAVATDTGVVLTVTVTLL